MSYKKWTEEETELLKKYIKKHPNKRVLGLFPNRTWNAIKLKLSRLKIKWYGVRVKRKCKQCNGIFKVYPSRVKYGGAYFCSKLCFDNWQSKKKKVKCEICSKEDLRKPSRIEKHIFCSIKCRNIFLRRSFIPKEILEGLYLNKRMTTIQIAKEFKKSRSQIFYQLKYYGIKTRSRKELWKDDEYRKKVVSRALKAVCKKPTTPETKLINIIKKYNLPFRYTGNGQVILWGLNPDFVECNGRKLIIEVFGDYWHNRENTPSHQTEKGRKAIFSKLGYETLIIWERELNTLNEKQIVNKIEDFMTK